VDRGPIHIRIKDDSSKTICFNFDCNTLGNPIDLLNKSQLNSNNPFERFVTSQHNTFWKDFLIM
jgi:hypothetical protein